MQLFDENLKRNCCCSSAIKKAIYTKSFDNDSFSIYGNVMHGKSILLNYHGKLIEDPLCNKNDKKKIPNIYLYYCFDNNWNDKKIINMNVCNSKEHLSYCHIIDIPEHSNINIAFTNDKNEWDTAINGTYYVKIYPDIEKAIIKRYGLDSTPPTIPIDSIQISKIKKTKSIKEIITSIFSVLNIPRICTKS